MATNNQRVQIAGMGAQIVLDFLSKTGREMWLSRAAVRDLKRLAEERVQCDGETDTTLREPWDGA